MSGTVTVEELKAMLDVQAKSTEQMVIIAGKLQTILENQEKISERQITDSEKWAIAIPRSVIKEVTDFVASSKKGCEDCHNALEAKVDKVGSDVKTILIIFGAITFISAVAVVIVKVVTVPH